MKRLVYIFVGLLVVLVLLIAAIAILYFRGFLGGGECTFADDVDHVCAESNLEGCEGYVELTEEEVAAAAKAAEEAAAAGN